MKRSAPEPSEDSGLVLRVDPIILPAAVVVLFLMLAGEPWWTMTGTSTNSLLTMQVSPYYFQTNAIGLARSVPFADFLGSFTRLLLFLGLLGLAVSSVRPTAWWRDLAVYFGLCSLTVLYLSFFLMYQGAQTALLAAYGVIPPYLLSGASNLPARIIGLDLNTYANPSVTGGFSLPFYLGFLGLGLLGGRLIIGALRDRKKRPRRKGVAAIFSSENNGPNDRNEMRGVSLRVWTLLLVQLALIARLASSSYNELVHNLYSQTYLSNLLSLSYGNILLGTIVVSIALVLIDGLRVAPPGDQARNPGDSEDNSLSD